VTFFRLAGRKVEIPSNAGGVFHAQLETEMYT